MKIYFAGERPLKSFPVMRSISNRMMTYFYHNIKGGTKASEDLKNWTRYKHEQNSIEQKEETRRRS